MHPPEGTKGVLRVGGEPRKKIAGPILRGTAMSRTLQDQMFVMGVSGDQTESDVTHHVELFVTH